MRAFDKIQKVEQSQSSIDADLRETQGRLGYVYNTAQRLIHTTEAHLRYEHTTGELTQVIPKQQEVHYVRKAVASPKSEASCPQSPQSEAPLPQSPQSEAPRPQSPPPSQINRPPASWTFSTPPYAGTTSSQEHHRQCNTLPPRQWPESPTSINPLPLGRTTSVVHNWSATFPAMHYGASPLRELLPLPRSPKSKHLS
jgi:hypothetical protein